MRTRWNDDYAYAADHQDKINEPFRLRSMRVESSCE